MPESVDYGGSLLASVIPLIIVARHGFRWGDLKQLDDHVLWIDTDASSRENMLRKCADDCFTDKRGHYVSWNLHHIIVGKVVITAPWIRAVRRKVVAYCLHFRLRLRKLEEKTCLGTRSSKQVLPYQSNLCQAEQIARSRASSQLLKARTYFYSLVFLANPRMNRLFRRRPALRSFRSQPKQPRSDQFLSSASNQSND